MATRMVLQAHLLISSLAVLFKQPIILMVMLKPANQTLT